MKRLHLFITSVALFLVSASSSQETKPYVFSNEVIVESTATKDQCNTGTCWSYATSSFLESELMRMGKGNIDLSEMFNVRMTYPKKAERFVRYQGKWQFGPGSLSHDVINVVREYGMVPESAYPGIAYGSNRHDHGELDALLEAMLKALIEKRSSSTGVTWKKAIDAVLDAYLGAVPESFTFNGKSYTPASFRDAMGLKANDYVSLTSFSHHPYYSPFVLEVPDNFSQGSFWNVTLDELEQVVITAIANGYSVAWDADVSEKGFSFRHGIAILPEASVSKEDYFKKVVTEVNVTQDLRQSAFDNFQTTDDHLMHIVGTAKDQNGTTYFLIKNSWGSENPYNGYQYISSAYFRMKTVGILLHKDAVSKEVRSRLKL